MRAPQTENASQKTDKAAGAGFNTLAASVILVCGTVFFSYFTFRNIGLPGLFDDEAISANSSFPLFGLPSYNLTTVKLAGIRLPLMYHPFHAAGNAYFIYPFFKLSGISSLTLRVSGAVYCMLALILFYNIAMRLLENRLHASIAVFSACTHPTLILAARNGYIFNSLHILAGAGAVFALLEHMRTEKSIYAALCGLLLGAGFSAHSSFIYFVSAFLVSGSLFSMTVRPVFRPGFRNPAIFSLFMAIGLFPFIAGNIRTRFETLKFFTAHFNMTSSNFDNRNYLTNLGVRLTHSKKLLDATALQEVILLDNDYQPAQKEPDMLKPSGAPYYLIFLALGAGFLIYDIRRAEIGKKAVFLLFLPVFYLLLSPFSLSALSEAHLTGGFLFLSLCAGYVFIRIYRLNRISSVILLFLTACGNYNILRNYHGFIERTGGIRRYSSAVYDLAGWIRQQGIKDIVTCDWGFHHNIFFLTKGIKPEWAWENPVKPFTNAEYGRLSRLLDNRKNIFIFRDNSPNLAFFLNTAERSAKPVRAIRDFYQKDGFPIYRVFGRR